jgi:DNA polymerase II large subunit
LNISKAYKKYVDTMENQLKELYAISDTARSKGLDPALRTECIRAQDIADLVEGLVGPKGVALSIRELSANMPREEVGFNMRLLRQMPVSQGQEQLAEQAIRTPCTFTEGLMQFYSGIAQVKVKQR